MGKQKIVETNRAPKAVGPYSQGIDTGNFVFVSGQLPVNPESGKISTQDIREQTSQVIDNIENVLIQAGLSLKDVVRCDVFLKDMSFFSAMNEIYASRFINDPKPARQAVQVVKLPLDSLVEISCIAIRN